MTPRRPLNGMVAAGVLSLAVGVERLLNAALVESLVAPSTRLVLAASYTATGGIVLAMGLRGSRRGRGREETRGRADS